MIAIPAPIPQPTAAPENVVEVGPWARAGVAMRKSAKTINPKSCTVFMKILLLHKHLSTQFHHCQLIDSNLNDSPAGLMCGMQSHSHKESCEKCKNIGLKKRNKEFQQTQRDYAQNARD